MQQFQGLAAKPFPSVSALLEGFYQERDNAAHIRQKVQDMRKLVTNHIERCVKKKEIQLKTRRETKGMDLWKKKGELLTANIYAVPQGVTTFKTIDYYESPCPKLKLPCTPQKHLRKMHRNILQNTTRQSVPLRHWKYRKTE